MINLIKDLIEQGMKYVSVLSPARRIKEKRADYHRKMAMGIGYEQMMRVSGWSHPDWGLESFLDRMEQDADFKLMETGASSPEIPEITEKRMIKRIKDHVALIIVQKEKAREQLTELKPESEE